MVVPGEIVVVDFPGIQGVKRRPAIVLSSELYHRNRPDVILGLITSQTGSAKGPTDYILEDSQAAGLHVASAFRAFVITLPQSAVTARIGHASSRDWQAILNRVRLALAH